MVSMSESMNSTETPINTPFLAHLLVMCFRPEVDKLTHDQINGVPLV